MRAIRKLEPLAGVSEWELAREFAGSNRWPYYLQHQANLEVSAHYHTRNEELQVLRGSMTFTVLSGTSAPVDVQGTAGERLVIPEGTVHRVKVGPEGVTYVMGLDPVIHANEFDNFPVYLPVDSLVSAETLAELVEINYRMSEVEEATANNAEKERATDFFNRLLARDFVFVGVAGDVSNGGDPIQWTVDLSGFVFRSSFSKKRMIDVGAVGISRSLRDFQTPVDAFCASTGVAASTSSSTARKFSTTWRTDEGPLSRREVERGGIPE